MAQIPRFGSLEIDQDLEFERSQWRVQRAVWRLSLLVAVAGLLGLFGSGPLSHGTESAGPLAVEYQRLAREGSPAEIEIHLAPEVVSGGEATIWIDNGYLETVTIEHMVPEPAEMAAGAGRTLFLFRVARPEQSQITIGTEPAEPGMKTGRVGLVDGPEVAFDQFVYP